MAKALTQIETKRQRYEKLRAQLENERTSFLSHWRDLADFICPRRPRFFVQDVNRGERRNQKITDTSSSLAHRTLRSGMMGGITSPARPWFRLATPDPAMEDIAEVKAWLYAVSNRMSGVFLKSNLYQMLPTLYGDLGLFATGAMIIEEDFENVIRTYTFPIGSYTIANDERLRVKVFMREFQMTIRQLIQRFGEKDSKGNILNWNIFSQMVKDQYDQGMMETWVQVVHVIEPNLDHQPNRLESKYKKFSSCYYERGAFQGAKDNQGYLDPSYDSYLSEKGYDYFPVLVPRWEVTGEDVYGTNCPGMEALGDVKQLMLGEKRTMQAIDKMVNPPMVAPTSMRNSKTSILPGDISYLDVREGQQGFRPAHEVNPRIVEMEQKQQQVRQRISRAFYEDLFLMLAESDRREITATEIDERKEEKLLALGPVLEQLNQDLLDPLIDITFQIMLDQNLIPMPPQQLHGVKLKVEYVSIMAQAQKLIGVSSIERFASFAAQVGQVHPESLDKIDADQMIEAYGDMTSVPPGVIRPEDQVNQIRQQRQQAQQQQAQQQAIQQNAVAAKNLSQTDTGGQNALTDLLKQAQAGQIAPQQ